MAVHGRGGRGGGSRIHPLQPVGPQPLASPNRCAIARCHRCPLRILSRQSQVPGPAVRIPASAPPGAYPPGRPAGRACLPGGLAVSTAARRVPFSSSAATSLGAPVPGLPGRTPGNYYGLGRGKGGGGRREGRRLSHSFPLSAGLPQLLSMPSCPASPWEDCRSARSWLRVSWLPEGGWQ